MIKSNKMTPVLKTVYSSNSEILEAIELLHIPDGFQCDMTFGNGSFWKGRKKPEFCFDVSPINENAVKADSRDLPIETASLKNCVFDPPFLTYVKNGRNHQSGKVLMSSRFGGYYYYSELEDHYKGTLKEAYRILKQKGVLVFKCQDIIHNHKIHPTHIFTHNWAVEEGFKLLDLFILTAKNRMPSPQKGQQRHARIFHSYFLVFKK